MGLKGHLALPLLASALALELLTSTLAPAYAAPEDGPWALELIVAAEPPQPHDPECNRDVDCLTTAKAFFGGALRGRYRDVERWSIEATLGLTTLIDQEERPPSYGALTLRIDAQLELGRARDRFGIALRLSPSIALGWAEPGASFATDLPGLALLVGTTTHWGELGIPTLPTPADPRQFYLAWGFALGRWTGSAGIANFATLGWGHEGLDATATWPGVYGDIAVRVSERFDLRVMAVLSKPVMLSLGFGWRFAR